MGKGDAWKGLFLALALSLLVFGGGIIIRMMGWVASPGKLVSSPSTGLTSHEKTETSPLPATAQGERKGYH
jgi:hypothetical protein